jgi:hypothetical protein
LSAETGSRKFTYTYRYLSGNPVRRFAGHAIFALSQSKAPDGHILAIAHKDPAEHVRSQAYFWLAQMGDERAQGDITAALKS